jgi:NAD(P)-dependent dehydrogenase (short-subunit alcohol dehydrogenase family)
MGRVIVTGAGGAVAGGVLESLIESGWKVAGLTRDGSPGSAHDGVMWFGADLTDAAAVRAAVESASAALGGLDALVCLAGGFRLTPLDEATWSDFEQLLSLDFRSTVETVLAAIPFLATAAESSGDAAIVTIGARAALSTPPRSGPYVAAKAAVIAWSGSLAAELRPRQIRVNCVLPGTVDTPANRESMPNAKTATWVPPRRLGELIRFLAGPDSAPLSGAAIPIG